ncbi:acyloxyacyl hydrolase [Pseudoalteromonas gelatinilytica]
MKRLMTIFLLILPLISGNVLANKMSYSADYIRGESDVEGVKLALQYHTDLLKNISENLNVYFETSVNFWEYGETKERDTNFVLAFSPVVQYPIGSINQKKIFVEFGIGLSLLDDTNFAGKDVGGHFQFEDRLGLMTRFGENDKHQIALRYFHYSNGGLNSPNPGLDFIAFSYMRYF